MIEISEVQVVGFKPAIRGMRNPLNSWDKSDSVFDINWVDKDHAFIGHKLDGTMARSALGKASEAEIGPNDLKLMKKLANAGADHAKYRRMIVVYADIIGPLYWWKEFDTYKIGTVANSCSTMHKLAEKEFSIEDFSKEHLITSEGPEAARLEEPAFCSEELLRETVQVLNRFRSLYISEKKADQKNIYWWQMIQILPSSYNQKRTVMVNYEVLSRIYTSRKAHKLDEWRSLCEWAKSLPYAEGIIF